MRTGKLFVLSVPVFVGLAVFVTTAAARASSNRPPADATLPANPALRSLETRARYGTDAMAEALSQLGGKLPASGVGHLGVTGPDPSPDLRPLREASPTPSVPGSPFYVPDPLNPIFKNFQGPFRPNLPDRDHSNDPSPSYTEAERKKLVEEGKDLFFSTTAFVQRPSKAPLVPVHLLSLPSYQSGRAV